MKARDITSWLLVFSTTFLAAQTKTTCQFQIIAGPSSTFGGDGGPASLAWLFDPKGLAMDPKGNLLIADTRNNRIRRVAADGTITTVAGNGIGGFSGDGGAAVDASLSGPTGLVAARDGTLFVSDSGNNVIRAITADGNIRTVVGTGHPGFDGDGNFALAAELNTPAGLALDSKGQLFIADSANNRIRRIDGNGLITTVAGGRNDSSIQFPDCCYSGDGGPATDAHLNGPRGVTIDNQGNLLVADTLNNVVRAVDANGVITTIVGGAQPGASSLPAPAGNVFLFNPETVAVLTDGSVLLPNLTGILRLSPDRLTVSAFGKGSGLGHVVSSDSLGRAYTNGNAADVIWRITPDGSAPERFAGQTWYGAGVEGGAAIGTTLHTPMGIAVGSDGSIYVADRNNGRVVTIRPDGTIHTLAAIADPEFVAIDADGVVYVSDVNSKLIRKITTAGSVSVFAGGGLGSVPKPNSTPVVATSINLNRPFGLVTDPDGNLYAFVQPDFRTSAIVKITPSGMLSTLYLASASGLIDTFHGLTLDGQGNILVGSKMFSNGTAIYRIDTSGKFLDGLGTIPALSGNLENIAGNGSGALFSVDADGRIKQLSTDNLFASIFNRDLRAFEGNNFSMAISTDIAGNLFLSEGNFHRIRKLSAGSCAAQPGPVIAGVVNSANFDAARSPVGFAPGELISIFGYFMGPQTGVGATLDSTGRFPSSLAGVRVLFDGVPGIVLYASASQVNVIVPFTTYGRDSVRMEVEKDGIKSDALLITMAESAPSVFSLKASGDVRDVTVFNQDGSLNSQANPAAPGSTVVMYATGLGRTDPAGQDGHLATAPYPTPRLPLTATSSVIQYAGDAPGLVEGFSQINFQAPTATGFVLFQQGGVKFNVFVWVR